ncbi:MAG: 5-formyltetrahydrofolate cyclo-ligase [Burkholderiales bacterium]
MAGQIAADALAKSTLRKQIIAARDALLPAVRRELSARITAQLLALDAYRNARCVLAYMSFGSEFETATLIEDALAYGKAVCLPRVVQGTRELALHRVTNLGDDLQSGTWGIREPRADRARADIGEIDFVLLPGVAFTPRCERLGYGGGFYDRLITRMAQRPPLAAAAFALQMRDGIPLDANDQRVDIVVTEISCYRNC